MKKSMILGFTSLSLIVLSGCVGPNITLRHSNQVFIEETIDELKIGEEIKTMIPADKMVALKSIENDSDVDRPLEAMIEDQMISSLVNNGVKVCERDSDAITNILSEDLNSNYSIHLDNTSYEQISTLPFAETDLLGADYLLSYRILECGLLYKNGAGENVEREGVVRLHVRLQDTETGIVTLSKNLTGFKTYEIHRYNVRKLSNYHYAFFPYEYPLADKQLNQSVDALTIDLQPKNQKLLRGIGIPVMALGYTALVGTIPFIITGAAVDSDLLLGLIPTGSTALLFIPTGHILLKKSQGISPAVGFDIENKQFNVGLALNF